jgi:hypothetical protein
MMVGLGCLKEVKLVLGDWFKKNEREGGSIDLQEVGEKEMVRSNLQLI